MNLFSTLLLALSCMICAANCAMEEQQPNNFRGSKVFRVRFENADQVARVMKLHESTDFGLDFWTDPRIDGLQTDIHVIRPHVQAFRNLLQHARIPFKITINNLEPVVRAERIRRDIQRVTRQNSDTPLSIVGEYIDFDDLEPYLEGICESLDWATCESIGTTEEGRKIPMIKLSKQTSKHHPGSRAVKKEAIWLHSNIHAREWITHATTIWILNEFVTKHASDAKIAHLLDSYDWFIVPLLNPDGYVYTKINRYWRKNRAVNGGSCKGVDLNRNFGYEWGGSGASTSKCSDTYRGPSAFSEPETSAVRDTITRVQDSGVKFAAFFSFHSYSQMWLTNWGYTKDRPDDYDDIMKVSNAGIAAIKAVNNKYWVADSPPEILYAASGVSNDWAYGGANIKYSFVLELRPGQGSFNGFSIPASNIEPSGQEIYAGLQASIAQIEDIEAKKRSQK